jgi:hypothetical protein
MLQHRNEAEHRTMLLGNMFWLVWKSKMKKTQKGTKENDGHG